MPRRKSTPSSTDVLSYLAADRRAVLEGEIVSSALREAINGSANIRALVEVLTHHALWDHIGQLPATALSGKSNGSARASAPSATGKRKPGRPRKDASATSSDAAAGASKGDKGAAASGKGKRTGRRPSQQTQAITAKLLECIQESPGIRPEEIFARVGEDKRKMKAILKKLRAAGEVKVSGAKRGSKYSLPGVEVHSESAAASPAAADAAPKVKSAKRAVKAKSAAKGKSKEKAPAKAKAKPKNDHKAKPASK